MANIPDSKEIGSLQKLIQKSPAAFTAAIFCIAFATMYYLNVQKNNDAEAYWKELYIGERNRNDRLTTELLINNGIIQKQNEVIIKADSTLKDNVAVKVEKILRNEKDN